MVSFFRGYASDDRGATAVFTAIAIIFLLGFAALATDLGYLYNAKIRLQQSADAAALAGATYIVTNGTTNPITEAETFDSASGNLNASNFTVLASGVTVTLKCVSTLVALADPCVTGFPGAPVAGDNAIQVTEQATVPAFFSKIFGIKNYAITATSSAAAKGGQPSPLDVEIVLDTTASMAQSDGDPYCGLGSGNAYGATSNATKISCALIGVQTLLQALSPSVQKIGLMVFPPLTAGLANNELDYTCNAKAPTIVPYYNSTGQYNIISLTSNYRTSNGSKTLNQSSNIVDAAGGVSGCAGIQAPGGDGTYYAAAITAAQGILAADGDVNTKQAIVFLSDGEANATNEVQSVALTAAGSGYTAAPTVTFTAPTGSAEEGGTAAAPTVTVTMTGKSPNESVASVVLKTNGGGYTATPKMTFSAPTSKGGVTATGTATLTSPPGLQQCNGAVTAAAAAKTAGIYFYSIAYGSSTSTSDCSTDTAPTITPCAALQAMATSTADFYSDGTGGSVCPNATAVTNLASAFTQIASSITAVRLIPDAQYNTG